MRTGKTKFYDAANFPHGFSRSGFFTIKEAEVLETYGKTLKALSDGSESPMDDDEIRFISEITDQSMSKEMFARVWSKYLARTNTKVRLLTLTGSSRGGNEEVSDASADTDDVAVLDDD